MNSMTFQKDGDYIVCYINGKEMGRAKMATIGISEEDIEQMIEANPEGEATDTLNKIKLFNTIYELSTGTTYSAGTNIQISEDNVISATIEANPAGTATAILEKLKVGNTIYNTDKPKYLHMLTINGRGTIYIINNSDTAIDTQGLINFMQTNNYTSNTNTYKLCYFNPHYNEPAGESFTTGTVYGNEAYFVTFGPTNNYLKPTHMLVIRRNADATLGLSFGEGTIMCTVTNDTIMQL